MEKKMIFILCSIVSFSIFGAVAQKHTPMNEILMKTEYKIIENGYLIFLVFQENKVKKLEYSYSINLKAKSVTCSKVSELIYNLTDDNIYLNGVKFITAEKFKLSQVNTWREKYYKCFEFNFLERSNAEKITLLEKLCK